MALGVHMAVRFLARCVQSGASAQSRTITAGVIGTGFRSRRTLIRRHCQVGSVLQLRREPFGPHDVDAVGVWLECSSCAGMFKSWRQIGYLKGSRASSLAKEIDAGRKVIVQAIVRSVHAPVDEDHPKVSMVIETVSSSVLNARRALRRPTCL